jgi:hypothetical protein
MSAAHDSMRDPDHGQNCRREDQLGIFTLQSVALASSAMLTETKASHRKKHRLRPWAPIEGIGSSSIGQHRANVGFGDGLAVDFGIAVKPPHGLAPTDGM